MFSNIQSPYGKIFFTLVELCKEKTITSGQKGYLKDLLIAENQVILPLIQTLTASKNLSKEKSTDNSTEQKAIESFLLKILTVPSPMPARTNSIDNPQQGLSRFQTNQSIKSSHSKSFSLISGARFRTNQELDNFSQIKDDSVIEYSMISEEAKLLMNKSRFSKNSMEMSRSLLKDEKGIEPEADEEDNEEDNEEDEDEYQEGGFNDYYKNIEDEYDLPPINDLSRMESNQVFMRTSFQTKNLN